MILSEKSATSRDHALALTRIAARRAVGGLRSWRGRAGPPGCEDVPRLLARRVVVPATIPGDQSKQLVQRDVAVPFGGKREREVEAALRILRVGGEVRLVSL